MDLRPSGSRMDEQVTEPLVRGQGPADGPHQARLAWLRPATAVGLRAALTELGLTRPRPVLILVGGAANLDIRVKEALIPVFTSLALGLDHLGALVIDGGTPFGVMELMGRARHRLAATFPLLGMAPQGRIALDAQKDEVPDPRTSQDAMKVPLDPHHSHFLLVPGDRWGDESPWMQAAAEAVCAGHGSLMLVAGGGKVTRLDLVHRLRAGGSVLLLAGTGGTADDLAAWYRAGRPPLPGLESGSGLDGASEPDLVARLDQGPDPDLTGLDPALIELLDLAQAATRLPDFLARTFTP